MLAVLAATRTFLGVGDMRFVVIIITLLLYVPALAADLTFRWTDTQPGVLGYRLYVDSGDKIVKDAIAPDARTVTVPMISDGKSHVYFLTAYNAEEESRVSDVVIVKPARPARVADFGGM